MKTTTTLSILVLSGFLFTELALASGGWRPPRQNSTTTQRTQTTVPTVRRSQQVPAPAPLISPALDSKIRAEVVKRGAKLPGNWDTFSQSQREKFLADLDFIRKPATKARRGANYRKFTGQRRAIKRFADEANITYRTAVNELYQRGILDGNANGTFAPKAAINRAESLKVLFEAVGQAVPNSTTQSFRDVPAGAWFAKYVNLGKQRGIVKGYPDGSFRPADTVNQVELLKLAFESFGIDLNNYPVNNLPRGIDSNAWFAVYLQYALDNNLLDRNLVSPGSGLSRELFAEVIHRLIVQQESIVSTTPVAAEEEQLSAAEAAEFAKQQAAARAAQAEREAVLATNTFETIATGSIAAESGKSASGGVTVEAKGDEVMITLESNFNISNGPDLFVTLTTENATGKRSLNAQQLITLDALASTSGKQVYTVSKADFDKYGRNLVIWCRAFNVVFGATGLR